MTSSFILPFVALLAVAPTDEPAAGPDDVTTDADPDAEPAADPAESTDDPPEAAPPEADAPDGESEGGTDEVADDATTESPDPFPEPPPEPPPTAMAPVKKPPPARPIRWRLDLGLGVGATLVTDRGFRAMAPNRLLPEGIVKARFDFRLAESRFFLGGGLAYQRLGRNGDAYSILTNDLVMHEPEVLGRLAFATLDGLDVFARVGVGPSIVDMSFSSFEYAEQRSVLPRVDGQAGLSLYLPKAWLPRKQASRVSAGLDLGVGYTWRGNIEVQLDLSQGDEPLTAQTSPFGDLSLHGLSWRMGVFIRVM